MRRSSNILSKGNPLKNLRVQSHILGASFLIPNHMVGKAKEMESFYTKLFSASLWPKNLFSRTAQRCLWVPRIAQTYQQIEMGELKQFFHNFGEPECIVGVNCQEHHTSLVVSSESQCQETLPFLVTPVERHMELFTDPDVAPFKEQPKQCGVVNWADICVGDENERRVALQIASMFGWHMSVPYKTRDENSVYISCFNGSGGVANRHKIAGILPWRMLLKDLNPGLRSGIPLMFFSCGSKELVEERIKIAEANGGKLLVPLMFADGDVAVMQDPAGCPFGLYHRTDDWHATKEGTELTWDLISMPSVDPPK